MTGITCGSAASNAGGAADMIPDAVNWALMTGGIGSLSNASQTINGISVPIALRATISSVTATNGGGSLEVSSTGESVTIGEGATFSFTVSNGQSRFFTSTVTGGPSGSVSYAVSVTNDSDGGASVDTFSVFHSWP